MHKPYGLRSTVYDRITIFDKAVCIVPKVGTMAYFMPYHMGISRPHADRPAHGHWDVLVAALAAGYRPHGPALPKFTATPFLDL